ncbi:MAG: acyltransferase family protein [Coleofasciculus sp. G1-WW12-02]|uniref:acyltransferase family protein n=1 Tax=Coleofasciculus sp. G1-WW12-02 TaxID=3068483 RepID=UPI0032FD9650
MLTKNRIKWLDVCRGIGIITVVIVHTNIAIKEYLLWFNMPLFFFLSGYFYKPRTDYIKFLKVKLIYFLVPYMVFLVLLSIPEYTSYTIQMFQDQDPEIDWIRKIIGVSIYKLYGGNNLWGWFGVFWFITCLFFTQQFYNLIYNKFGSRKMLFFGVIISFYCLAMLDQWFLKGVNFPWNINVVAMALPFYCLGHLSARYPTNSNQKIINLAAIIIFATGIILAHWLKLNLILNMKIKMYGIFIVNILLATSGIILVQNTSKWIGNFRYIENILMELGKSSLVIMYLHLLVLLTLKNVFNIENELARIIIALIIPYLLYKIISLNKNLRKLFLGDFKQDTVPNKSAK